MSTSASYSDPNNRLADFGGKKFGLDGDTHGWQHHFVDLSEGR